MSTGARLGVLAALVAAAILVLVLVNKGGSDSSTTTSTSTSAQTSTSTTTVLPKLTTITVKDAKPVGGITKIKVKKGDQIRFAVKSDTSDEVHVHGYDRKAEVSAGGGVVFSFPATIDGNFEVELERHAVQIAQITVEP